MRRSKTKSACECPPRPSIPPVLLVALGLWLSCAGVLAKSNTVADNVCAGCGALALIGAGVCLFCCIRLKQCALFALALGACLGMICASAATIEQHALAREGYATSAGEKIFLVVTDPSQGEFGQTCFAQIKLASGHRAIVQVHLPDDASVCCWHTYRTTGKIEEPNQRSAQFYWSRGAVASLNAHTIEYVASPSVFSHIAWIRNHCIALFNGCESDGAAFMKGILFGDRSDLFSRPVYGDVKAVGLAHIVAVSGAHLALIAGLAALLLQLLRLPRAVSIVALISFIGIYVVFTGAPQSAIRAAVMTLCALMSFFAKRRASALAALGTCAVILIAFDPFVALSISFALSAASTLGITLFARYAGAWCAECLNGHCTLVSDTLGTTFSANAFTFALSVPTFGQLSLISPLANLIIGPLFAFVCMGGVVCVGIALLVPPLQAVTIPAACIAGEAVCLFIHLIALVPFACIPADGSLPLGIALTCLVAAGLWAWWPQPQQRVGWGMLFGALIVSLLAFGIAPILHGNEIVMLDIGQGDALLIRTGRQAMLVDTGTHDAQLLAGLGRHDVRHLDAVLITHPDDDHCGSLPALLDAVEVDRVLVAADLLVDTDENCERLRRNMEGAPITGLHVGDTVAIGNFTMQVISPKHYTEGGGNADSIVMTVGCDTDRNGTADISALFTGDAEADVLEPLTTTGAIGAFDIFKVPHHGSRGGVNEQIMQVVNPTVSLVSAGKNNRYGHPTAETLQALKMSGSATYRTDESGDVVCALTHEKIRVTTQR